MQLSDTAPARRWTNRPPVRERDELHARRAWGVLLAILAAFVPAAFLIYLQAQCVAATYDVNALRSRRDELTSQARQLQLERARLESLARIEDWAEDGNEFVLPETENTIVVVGTAPGDGSLLARAPDRQTAPAD